MALQSMNPPHGEFLDWIVTEVTLEPETQIRLLAKMQVERFVRKRLSHPPEVERKSCNVPQAAPSTDVAMACLALQGILISQEVFVFGILNNMKDMKITLANDSATEKEAAARLRVLLDKYDISKYMFTNSVRIERKAIPHSHPVLTLNSFPYTDENIILEMFIHEQLHWYLESTGKNVSGAGNELKEKYPDAPWRFPLGCKDLESTYNHLILCFLSHNAMVEIVGEGAAKQVLYYLQNHHYLWVYQTIEADADYLASLIAKYDLALATN